MPVLLWVNPQQAVRKWYETEKDDVTNLMFKDSVSFTESRMGLTYECKVDYEMKGAPSLTMQKDGGVSIKLEYRLPLEIRSKSFNSVCIKLSLHSVIYIVMKSIDDANNVFTKIYINLTQTIPFWQTMIAEKAKSKAKDRINRMISEKLPVQLKYFRSILTDLDKRFNDTGLFLKPEKSVTQRSMVVTTAVVEPCCENTDPNDTTNVSETKRLTSSRSKQKANDAYSWICVARYYTSAEDASELNSSSSAIDNTLPIISDQLGCYQLLMTTNSLQDVAKTKFEKTHKSQIEREFTRELEEQKVYIEQAPVATLDSCRWDADSKRLNLALTLKCQIFVSGYKSIVNSVKLSVQPAIVHNGWFESYLACDLETCRLQVESNISMTPEEVLIRAVIPVFGWIEAGVESIVINNKSLEMKNKLKDKCVEKLSEFKIEIPETMRNYMAPIAIQIERDVIYCG